MKLRLGYVGILIGLLLLQLSPVAAGFKVQAFLTSPLQCDKVGVSVVHDYGGTPIVNLELRLLSNDNLITTISPAIPTGVATGVEITFPAQPEGTQMYILARLDTAIWETKPFTCSGTTPAPVLPPAPTPITTTNAITVTDPNLGDNDGDGVLNGSDNCPNVKNPRQENGWGGPAGDACDTDHYDSGDGVQGFPLRNGDYEMWSNCTGNNCVLIGRFDPDDFEGLASYPDFLRYDTPNSEGWFVDIFFLGANPAGVKVYQVNVYDNGGLLRDDGMLILIAPDGKVSWVGR